MVHWEFWSTGNKPRRAFSSARPPTLSSLYSFSHLLFLKICRPLHLLPWTLAFPLCCLLIEPSQWFMKALDDREMRKLIFLPAYPGSSFFLPGLLLSRCSFAVSLIAFSILVTPAVPNLDFLHIVSGDSQSSLQSLCMFILDCAAWLSVNPWRMGFGAVFSRVKPLPR